MICNYPVIFPQWGAADADINVQPRVGQYIAIHGTLTAWDFFLTYFYPSGPFTCIFSQIYPDFFPVLVVANTDSCIGLQNKIGHRA